jgi:hypothetical protein
MHEIVNSTAANSDTFPSGVGEIVEDFLTQFFTWKYIETKRYGKSIYITLKSGGFSDLHVKYVQRIARSHGFRLVAYGTRPLDAAEMLVTFVLAPRRK